MASTAAVLLGLAIYLALHLVLLKGVTPNEVIKTTLTLMAGLAAVLTGVYAYRKQRLSEADGARADADQTRAEEVQLTLRYSGAAEQLGHDKAAVRLAGVFAMARLADAWPNQRQQCIDVLCAYLRMPAQSEADTSEGEVRGSIVGTIASHLRDHSAISWVGRDFDFTGAVLYDADFAGVTFAGERTYFLGATFSGNTRFDGATFSARVTNFFAAEFSGYLTNFLGAKFSGVKTSFLGAKFSGVKTSFAGTTFSGGVSFNAATFSGDETSISAATFSGDTGFAHTTFSGEYTDFSSTTFSGEHTSFEGATFSGEHTSFDAATFSGRRTSFEWTDFFGATADEATAKASFIGETVEWGPIAPRPLPSPAAAG